MNHSEWFGVKSTNVFLFYWSTVLPTPISSISKKKYTSAKVGSALTKQHINLPEKAPNIMVVQCCKWHHSLKSKRVQYHVVKYMNVCNVHKCLLKHHKLFLFPTSQPNQVWNNPLKWLCPDNVLLINAQNLLKSSVVISSIELCYFFILLIHRTFSFANLFV